MSEHHHDCRRPHRPPCLMSCDLECKQYTAFATVCHQQRHPAANLCMLCLGKAGGTCRSSPAAGCPLSCGTWAIPAWRSPAHLPSFAACHKALRCCLHQCQQQVHSSLQQLLCLHQPAQPRNILTRPTRRPINTPTAAAAAAPTTAGDATDCYLPAAALAVAANIPRAVNIATIHAASGAVTTGTAGWHWGPRSCWVAAALCHGICSCG